MDTRDQTNWLLIGLLFAAGLFAAAQFAKLSLSLPALYALYPERAVLVAGLVSVMGLVGIVFGVVAGSFIAKIGMGRALIWGLVIGGLVSLLQALLLPFWLFAASRIVEGFAHLAIVVAAPTLMAGASSDRDRPVVMGIWAAFFGVSFALTAQLIPIFGGLSALMVMLGLGMLVMALLLRGRLPIMGASTSVSVTFMAAHKDIYSSPRLLIAGGGFVWYTLLYIALLAVLPGVLDLPVWASTAMPLFSLVGTFGAGFLARMVSPVRIAVAGFVGSAVLILTVALTPSILPGVLALMLVMGLIPGACFAAITHYNDSAHDRARATGAIAQLGNVGTTLGTPIFVSFAAAGGIAAISWGVVGFCAIGVLSMLALHKRIVLSEK